MQKTDRAACDTTERTLPPTAKESGQRTELWDILDALALCRHRYGLTSASLGVLRALITFLPRTSSDDTDLVVWPSNRTLAERADGMDERTLRRHLGRLCDAGLIERQSSSNGKRFALRIRGVVIAAFGFALRPLAKRAIEIRAAANETKTLFEEAKVLRTEILLLLHHLQSSQHRTEMEIGLELAARRELRRSPNIEVLRQIRIDLLKINVQIHSSLCDLTASDGQNDRHYQKTKKEFVESDRSMTITPIKDVSSTKSRPEKDPTLADCIEAASESIQFSQKAIEDWPDLVRLADDLAPMIGLEPEVVDHACRAMGRLPAAITILCIVQRVNVILKPGAYLRSLALAAERGLYSLNAMLRTARYHRFADENLRTRWA